MSSEEIPVALEGVETTDGRVIEPGALALPIGAVPVTGPGPQGAQSVIGRALGFRRDGDRFAFDLPSA